MKKFKNKNNLVQNKNQKGFALVVTIILSAIMLTVITLASKEMTDEMKNSAKLNNSSIAYYSAEAGIEDALLAYRYDHSKEITETCMNIDSIPATATSITNCGSSSLSHYYKLKMSNKTTADTLANVYVDNIYEIPIDASTITPTNINNISWVGTKDDTNMGGKIRLEATTYTQGGSISTKFFDSIPTVASPILLGLTSDTSSKEVVRIKPWYTDSTGNNGLSLTGTSNIPYITLNIPSGTSSSVTTINSVGYYGGVARKITMQLDRSSGNILNVFDYTIYSDSALKLR